MRTQQKTVSCHQCKKAFIPEARWKSHGVVEQHQWQTPIGSSTVPVKTASVPVANAQTLQSPRCIGAFAHEAELQSHMACQHKVLPSASRICKPGDRVFDSRKECEKHDVHDHWYTPIPEVEHARVPAVLKPPVVCPPYSNSGAGVQATAACEAGDTCVQDSLECVALDESNPGVSALSQLTVLSEDQRGTATANVDVPQGKEFEARVHSIKASPWASWSKNNQKGSDVSTVIESWSSAVSQEHHYTDSTKHTEEEFEQDGTATNMISSTPQWLEDSGQVETVNMDANGTLDAGCPSLIYPITQTTAESIGILGAHADVASDAAFEKNGAIGVHHPAQLKQEIQDLKEARRALLYEADQIVMKITDIEDKLHGPLQTWDEDGSTGEDAKLEAQAMSINRTARVSPESTKPITDEQISDIIVYQYLAAQFEDLHHMHPNALSTTSAGAESSASACATRATSPAISIFDDLAEELTEELSEWEEVPCEEADNDSDSHIMQPRAQLLPSEISDYVTIPPVEDA